MKKNILKNNKLNWKVLLMALVFLFSATTLAVVIWDDGVPLVFKQKTDGSIAAVKITAQGHEVIGEAIATGAEKDICKKISFTTTDNGVKGIFIPTKSALEWDLFRKNLPTGIQLSNCCANFGNDFDWDFCG